MSSENIKEEFDSKKDLYDSLGKNLVESIKILLKEAEIKILSITYRIKDFSTFIEKIERKSYDDPFDQMEDICGIRIICYFQTDISRIEEILSNELKVLESFNKESHLDHDQFGYRSHHLIGSIKKVWEKLPVFRGLSALKCEIQIRTVLMHAWAEIEHSLSYKSKAQTPTKFRRKINRISAKLEEADEQFEELKAESQKYQEELIETIKDTDQSVELNIDSLQAFMDNNFPNRRKNIETTGKLLGQMIENDISLQDLRLAWEKIEANFDNIENDYWNDRPLFSKWAQVGIARFVLSLANEDFASIYARSKDRHIMKYRKKYFSDS